MLFRIFFFIPLITFSQERLEIIHSNILQIDEKTKIKKLIGNVTIKHNETVFKCDSAYISEKGNIIEGFGHININENNSNLKSNYLLYNKLTKQAVTKDNVVYTNKHTKIYSDKLEYNTKQKKVNYYQKSKIVNRNNIIHSDIGEYNIKDKKIYLKNNVELKNNELIFKSDTLIHYPVKEKTIFVGPTEITTKNNFIYCEYGIYNEKNQNYQLQKNAYVKNKNYYIKGEKIFHNTKKSYSYVTEKSVFLDSANNFEIYSDTIKYFMKTNLAVFENNILLKLINKKDTLYLHSDSMKIINNKLIAENNVKFFNQKLQGKSNELTYDVKKENILLTDNPIIWCHNYQITGDKINIELYENKIKRLIINNNPFIIEKTKYNYYNQIEGENAHMIFKNSEIHRITIDKLAKSIYVVKEKNKIIGFNKSISQKMNIVFEKNKIKNIKSFGQIESTFTPINKENKQKGVKLRNFFWEEDSRPRYINDIF